MNCTILTKRLISSKIENEKSTNRVKRNKNSCVVDKNVLALIHYNVMLLFTVDIYSCHCLLVSTRNLTIKDNHWACLRTN